MKATEVNALRAEGVGGTEIARRLGIGWASVTLVSPKKRPDALK